MIHVNNLQTRKSDMLRSEHFELIAVHKFATAFRNDEAMLPYTNTLLTTLVASNFPGVESVSPEHVPGTRWLLSRLHSFFGTSLVVKCRQKRFGPVMFHESCDLVKALSTALGKLQSTSGRQKPSFYVCPSPPLLLRNGQ